MKVIIKTNTSEKIAALSKITLAHKKGYAAKHKYKVKCYDFNYDQYNKVALNDLHDTHEQMKSCDILMTCGADVMFMNWNFRIEDVLGGAQIMMAREKTTWWPINDDVMIWRCTPEVLSFHQRLIDDFPTWSRYPWRRQAHLWNLLQEETEVRRLITLVEPEVMNQHPTRWQLGQWIAHMYGMSIPDKITQAKRFAELWPDGQPVWRIQSDDVRPGVI